MEHDRWEEIERLYHAALERGPDGRAAFLDEACAGDEELRREVAGLLACDVPNDSFIQSPAIEIAARALAANQNEPPLPKPEQRTAPETLNTNVACSDDIKHETKSSSTVRRRIILVGLFFTLMCVSIGVNSYHSILYFCTAGDPGWLVGPDGRVRIYVGVSGADVSALRDGDELVLLDGQKFENHRQYFETFARHKPRAAYTMVVRRDGQMDKTEQLTLHTASYRLWLQIIIVLIQLVIPAVFLLTGLAIFLLRRDDKLALLLALMLGMMYLGVWPPYALLVADMPWLLTGMMAAGHLAGTGVLPVILHFFLIFPERSPLLVRFPRLEYYLYPFYLLTAGPFAVSAVFRLATAPERIRDIFQEFQGPIIAVGSLYLLGALLSLVVNYRKATQLSRRKLRLLLIGILAAFLPGSLFRLLAHLMPSLSVLWEAAFGVGLMMLLLFPLSFAYAIVRHQVIPVSLIIRRGLQYLLAKNALRLLLALPLIVLALTIYANRDRTVADLLFHNSVWFYASLLAAVALGLAYRYNLRDWLDRRFFREAYRQDKILRELTEEVRQLDSLTEMARRVSQKVDAALHPERLYLFYREEGRSDLSLGYSSDGASRDLRIPAEFELLRFMEYQGDAHDFPFPARIKLPPQEKEWLANLGASLIVPMRGTDDRLTGLLVLGPKKSEIPYTGSDRQLLGTLADQIALVYENAQLKERVAKDRRVQHEVLTRIAEQQINLLKECPQCGTCYDSAARICPKDQAELELTLPVERTLEGEYRLERLLGKGGMGAVYEATDLRLGRRVAVKVMTGSLFGDRAALRRFEREARALARLNHPNIIVVHDYGRAGAEGAYLVMELVAGTTLREALKGSGPLLPADAAAHFEQILAGLKAAHDAGVIHRDLKPENVLIAKQEDDRVIIKLLDFGLAKLRALDAADSSSPTIPGGLTTPGMVMGTFGYMSPEQLEGEEVDERSDIFAVGVIVVESLTGRRPFEGKSCAELLTAILHQPFNLPGDAPAVRRLDAVLQKCLAKERTGRYATVIELQAELIQALKACPQLSSLAQPRGEPDIALLPSNFVAEVKNLSDNRANLTAQLRLIAVLPFKPLSAVSRDETLEMGMADTLITQLSSLRQIIVRPLSAVYKYTGLEQDPLAAGREQRVEAVLDGSIQRTNEQIRITARLISVADGSQLWAGQFDEKFTNIFQVQDSICEKLVSALPLKLSGKEEHLLNKRYTDSPEAYQLYLKGRYEFYRFREESWRRAVAYFKEAINEDPLYALAHVGMSHCYIMASSWFLSPKEAMVKAEAWARKALEIDETLAEANGLLAAITCVYHWDWARGMRELKRVIELKPTYAEGHWGYGGFLAMLGRFDEGLAVMKQAQALDPLSLPIITDVGWVYYVSRRYTEAIEQLRQALELDPKYPEALVYLGRAYLAMDDFSQAIAMLEKACGIDDTPWIRAILGHALAVSGHSNEARHKIEQLKAMSSRRYVSPLHIAVIFIGLNEKEEAFSWLEKAYEERTDLLVALQVDPIYDPLQSDPRFQNMLRRIGFTP